MAEEIVTEIDLTDNYHLKGYVQQERGKRLTSGAHTLADRHSAAGSVEVINPSGAHDVLLVCEHASNAIPEDLDNLGLSGEILEGHIAWDPGALPVARFMSEELDAALVAQRVSRLVYDCNRAADEPDAIAERSEIHDIPGNIALSDAGRAARMRRFYEPFRHMLADCIEQRTAPDRRAPAIVTIHSFTPVYNGVRRQLDIGILHDRDDRLANAMLELAARDGSVVTLRNEPYGPRDGVTHTLVEHALPRGLLNVMIEIRSDLIADEESQKAMACRMSAWLSAARMLPANTARTGAAG